MRTPTLLVACEESQRVCTAFRERGWEAYSCDLLDCSGGHPEWHIKGDCLPILNGNCTFTTMDGEEHTVNRPFDLVIAHPPCTYLSNAGCVNLGRKDCICKTTEWRDKFFNNRCEAIIFFLTLLYAESEHIAVENQIGYMNTHYRKPDQIVEPYYFGDKFKKATGLWLKCLPTLEKTDVVTPTCKWVQQNKKGRPAKSEAWDEVGVRNKIERSRTFPGIAKAMADQWGQYIEEEIAKEQNNVIQ